MSDTATATAPELPANTFAPGLKADAPAPDRVITTTRTETQSDDPAPGMMNERSLIATLVIGTLCILEILNFAAVFYAKPGVTPPGISSEFMLVVSLIVGFLFGQNSKTK